MYLKKAGSRKSTPLKTQATLPKYLIRAFGCGTPIGLIYAINPTMILLLVPIVGAVTSSFHHFDMIHFGGYLSALSPLFIVAFNSRMRGCNDDDDDDDDDDMTCASVMSPLQYGVRCPL